MKNILVAITVMLALVTGPMPPSYAEAPEMTAHQEHVLIMNESVRERLDDRDMLMLTYDMPEEIADGILEFTEGDTSLVSIYEPDDLDTETIYTRTEHDFLIVERLVGVCLNENGDGRIVNTNSEFNYISYKYTTARTGDIVVTYCIYNPENDVEDDIIERFDMIICNADVLTES